MDDLINRKAAIDALDEIRHALWEIDIPSPTVPEYVEHHEQVQSVWKLLDKKQKELYVLPSAQPEPKWIPVKWREPDEKEAEYYTYMADCEMPEDEQEILVTDGKYVWKDVCYYDDGFSLDSTKDWQNITAWMPSPKPYKEGANE